MLPDLGKYAATVLAAYGTSIVLLVGLIVMSVTKGRRVRRQMQDVEARGKSDGKSFALDDSAAPDFRGVCRDGSRWYVSRR